jgi:hypothetical protein
MPWFPDFVAAAELVRRQTRARGQADPVAGYLAALTGGDTHDLETTWPGHISVFDPYAGEVRTHKGLRQLAMRTQDWSADHLVGTDAVASIAVDGRAVVEVLAHLTRDADVLWPLAVVAESPDDRSVVLRTYCSQRPVTGRRPVREPILEATDDPLGGIVGRYHAALEAGDADAIVATFAPDGYLREPIGPQMFHRGADELHAFFAECFRTGGIGARQCTVTDDGVRCAVEYNYVRWGARDLPPQAGIAVFERGADGLLTAARLYDDLERPVPH